MNTTTIAPGRRGSEPPRTDLSEAGRKYARKKALGPFLVLAPSFLLTIGILIPFIVAIFYSFTDLTLRSSEFNIIGIGNYVDTFTSPDFWHSVSITLLYAFCATAVEMLLGLGIALLLNGENRLSKFLRLVLIFPLMIAPAIGALVWQLMTNPSVGILRFPLSWIGLGGFRWSADPNWALFSVILIDVWIYTPFVVILALAGLRSLPKSPYEAALIDGGSAWFVFRNLTLPMLAPVLVIALIFRLMTSLQEFAIIFVSTRGGPGGRTLSLALAAYNQAFRFYNLAGSIPMLLFLWASIYAVCFILIGYWRKAQKISSGAVQIMKQEGNALGAVGSAAKTVLLILYALFALFPLLWMVILSFKPDSQMFTTTFIFTPTLENFRAVFAESDFVRTLWNNLVVSVLAVGLSLVIGVPAAYALGRFDFKGKEEIAFTFLSFKFAPEILVIIPLYLIYQQLHLIDSIVGLIWVYQLISLPLLIWILRGFFEDLSKDMEAAAQLDGYSWWQVFFKILLPLVKPGLVAAGLLCFIFCWNSFTFALLLGGGNTQTSTVSVTRFLASDTVHYGWVAAAALICALPGIILALLIQKHLVRGLSFGAVKG